MRTWVCEQTRSRKNAISALDKGGEQTDTMTSIPAKPLLRMLNSGGFFLLECAIWGEGK